MDVDVTASSSLATRSERQRESRILTRALITEVADGPTWGNVSVWKESAANRKECYSSPDAQTLAMGREGERETETERDRERLADGKFEKLPGTHTHARCRAQCHGAAKLAQYSGTNRRAPLSLQLPLSTCSDVTRRPHPDPHAHFLRHFISLLSLIALLFYLFCHFIPLFRHHLKTFFTRLLLRYIPLIRRDRLFRLLLS